MNYRKLLLAISIALAGPLAIAPHSALADAANNVLRVAGGDDPTSLDPAGGIASTDTVYLYALYDRLMTFNPETLEPMPMLAKSFSWENDYKTLVLELNEGVTFHDGASFNAEAVRTYVEYYKAAGKNTDLNPVTEVEVRDEYTVALTTAQPYAVLPSVLADRAGMVVSPKAIEELGADNIGTNPVGAGPFKLVEWLPGDRIVVEKFDDYWQDGLPRLSGIDFLTIANATARVSALVSGQVDFVQRIDPINLPVVDRNPNLRFRVDPTVAFSSINLNTNLEPLNSNLVRQALSYAIDREAIARLSYGPGVPIAPANLPVPTTYWPSTPEIDSVYQYHPEKARSLLAEAGYPDGVELTMCTPPTFASGSIPTDKVADLMRDQMQVAGFTLNTDNRASIGACIDIFNNQKAMQTFLVGWSGRPNPYMTYSGLMATQSGFNTGGTDYGADALLDKLKLPLTREEQEAVFDELNAIWIDQMPQIPIFYTLTVSAFGPDVAGEIPDLAGKWDVTHFYFEQ